MSTAIKRIKQFSYGQMNSIQSEQRRMHKNDIYQNKHIDKDFKKFNMSLLDNTEGLTYNQYYKKYCKRRKGGKKKAEVIKEMGEKDFYLDKLYTGKGSGKKTCCVEGIVVSLNKKIPATEEAIKEFKNDPENMQLINDYVEYFTKTDQRFKDCRFLNIDVHFDEIFEPWERKEPSELFPEGEIYKGDPKISVHFHITYIPLVKEKDKDGKEYYNHSRSKIWQSRTKNYRQSYSQFNDDIYNAVEKKYGYERGNLYEESLEDRKDLSVQEWISQRERDLGEEYLKQQKIRDSLKTAQEQTEEISHDLVRTIQDKEEKERELQDTKKEVKKIENEMIDEQWFQINIQKELDKIKKESKRLREEIESEKEFLNREEIKKFEEFLQETKEYNETNFKKRENLLNALMTEFIRQHDYVNKCVKLNEELCEENSKLKEIVDRLEKKIIELTRWVQEQAINLMERLGIKQARDLSDKEKEIVLASRLNEAETALRILDAQKQVGFHDDFNR